MVRARATVLGVTASALILAGGWELGVRAHHAAVAPAADATVPSAADPTQSAAASAATPTAAATPGASAASAPKTIAVTGASEATQYGSVQVRLTVRAGKIVDVTALHLTDSNGRSVAISNEAAPILRTEVLKAQSAKVQAVSGATYTTDGYLRSVQSAIDRAGI